MDMCRWTQQLLCNYAVYNEIQDVQMRRVWSHFLNKPALRVCGGTGALEPVKDYISLAHLLMPEPCQPKHRKLWDLKGNQRLYYGQWKSLKLEFHKSEQFLKINSISSKNYLTRNVLFYWLDYIHSRPSKSSSGSNRDCRCTERSNIVKACALSSRGCHESIWSEVSELLHTFDLSHSSKLQCSGKRHKHVSYPIEVPCVRKRNQYDSHTL